MPDTRTLDIIIPCFNPRKGWEKVLSESITIIKSELPKKVLQSVIVVNDGSSSGITDDAVASL
ncbi:MAG: hypothetical protein QF371_02155, partial [Flavobacteriales bacterium]|nr:hypothetical protein [Flavobacteriales bacterium]